MLCPGGSASPVRVELVENGAPFSEDAMLYYSVDDGTEKECTSMPEEGLMYGCGTDQEGILRYRGG